jgi:pyruvate dehydrogenase (quinone)
MTNTVSDFLVQRLGAWGVRRIFGYPGDGINGILGALQRAGKPEFIQVRHEEMAAFMACGHAKFTGTVGVCLATSGPGAIHLLNGLYDAKLDHQGVLAIVGQAARTAMGSSYQQEVDLESLFKDVAHEYVQTLMAPEQLPMLVDRALRIAAAERTVTCLIVPKDLQELEAVLQTPHKHDMAPGGLDYTVPEVAPSDRDLQRAATVLNEGSRVAILVGQGARGAGPEVIETAELLGAGVAKALLGKDVLPDDLPFVTGPIGLLGSRPSYDLMMECDTLLMIGSSFPYSEFMPRPGQARGVQIDLDARMIGLRYPMEVNLVGDSRTTLRRLRPLLQRKADRSWQELAREGMRKWWALLEARAMDPGDPINPQRVFWELSSRLPDGAIITCDSGSCANWYARDLKIRMGMRCSLSGNLATMGSGVPYAIAAKFAYPDRPVVALVGDGALQMNGLLEFLTISKYRSHWSDPRLVILVLHNNDLNQVTWEMRAMEGNPKFEASQEIPDFNYAEFARSTGLLGIRITTPESIGPAWEEAFRAAGPVVIDAVTDPNVPPLPPHITFKQARAMMSAMLKGDPDLGAVVRKSFSGVMREFYHPQKT